MTQQPSAFEVQTRKDSAAIQRTYRLQEVRRNSRVQEAFLMTGISIRHLRNAPDLTFREKLRLVCDFWPLLLTLTAVLAFLCLLVGSLWLTFFHGHDKVDHWFRAASGLNLSLMTLFGTIATVLCVFYLALSGYRISGEADLSRYGVIAGLMPVLFFAVNLVGLSFKAWRAHWKLTDPTDVLQVQILFLVTVLGLGAGAYHFKRVNKLYYGLSEVALSLISTWFLIAKAIPSLHPSHELNNWVALATATYVFSRGVGNTVEGLEERPAVKRRKARRAAVLARLATPVAKADAPPETAAPAQPEPVTQPAVAPQPENTALPAFSRKPFLFGQDLIDAADRGDLDAMQRVAFHHEHGIDGPPDAALARRWHIRCAQAGAVKSMSTLGRFYEDGIGGDVDFAQSNFWLQSAAAKSDPSAMFVLGIHTLRGQGMPIDRSAAITWFERSAQAGGPYAMAFLGRMYRKGTHVAKDEALARQWFERAALAGHEDSMKELADLLWLGRGGPRDYTAARRWYKAADDRNAELYAEAGTSA